MKTLSIRQPWAWLILHGGKDVENRTWASRVRGRVLIHASGTMTRAEYDDAAAFVAGITHLLPAPVTLPEFAALPLGGIVGSVEILRCVAQSESPWFGGPLAFVLAKPESREFFPCKGRLGFFEVEVGNEKGQRAL
jgi:hypothetical protein